MRHACLVLPVLYSYTKLERPLNPFRHRRIT